MRRLAVLSYHTSPLAQPGTGDGGGMNVYVRELSSALARAGVECDVFTRRWAPGLRPVVEVEPGLRVHHVEAGPASLVGREALPGHLAQFTDGVKHELAASGADALHANYWLSGVAGHALKHDLDLPLVVTFHTLDRVKAEASPEDAVEGAFRAEAEADTVGCADAVLASCSVEADQLVELYDAPRDRIEIVAPAVDHAFFAPGDQAQARRALGLPLDRPVVLFVGRIQPLKGLDVAVRALADLVAGPQPDALLVIVGGPSGPAGATEVTRIHALVDELGLTGHVRFTAPQPHELLSTFYRAADVCVVPSRSESFGLVALEAAACGTPVVASAVGGLQTLVDHGRTGYLVDGRDPADYAARLADVLGDHVLAASLGSAAAASARRYTWSVAAARLRRLYADLTSRSLVECQ